MNWSVICRVGYDRVGRVFCEIGEGQLDVVKYRQWHSVAQSLYDRPRVSRAVSNEQDYIWHDWGLERDHRRVVENIADE